MLRYQPHHYRRPFCLTLQNELIPNHANVTVKQIATTTPRNPARPDAYFAYSFADSIPPNAAIARKTTADNLQPQLMHHLPESAGRGGDGATRRPHRPAALDLLPGDARHHP